MSLDLSVMQTVIQNKTKGEKVNIKEKIQEKIQEAAGLNAGKIFEELAPLGAAFKASFMAEVEDFKDVQISAAEIVARATLAARFIVHTPEGPVFHKTKFEAAWDALQAIEDDGEMQPV